MGRSLRWTGLGLTLGLASVLAPMDWVPMVQGRSPFYAQFKAQFVAQAQVSIIIGDRWRRVYEQVPGLPLENTYVRRDTREVDSEDTVIERFMRYHLYDRGRSPLFRLDWKLSLGDYLGINETIPIDTYPGNTTFTENPRRGDMRAIASLSREQRQKLVDVLVALFTPEPEPATRPSVAPSPTPSPTPESGSASDLL